MYRQPHPRSLIRPNWVADMTAAVNDAERLLSLLEADGQLQADTAQLRIRVDAIRSEMEQLNQLIRVGDRVIGPPWPVDPGIHAANN